MGFDMHSAIQSEKAALAKLLATENLSVVYRSDINTAYFDLQTRTIYVPIMWGMDLDLMDLFDGHEVGHALYTPPEGYHDAVKAQEQNGQIDRAYASYLNVVEDVRIERKIKTKYPGLRRSFHRAYGQLVSKNFFSPDGETHISELVKNYTFIDKLNIHSKVGSHVYVEFTKEEQALVDECFAIETWDEVVAFVGKIYSRQLQLQEDQAAAAFSAMTAGNLLELQDQKPGEDSETEETEQLRTAAGQQADSDDSDSNDADSQADDSQSKNKPISVEPSVTDQAFRQNEQKMFSENASNEQRRRKFGNYNQPVTRCVVGKLPASRLIPAATLVPIFGKIFDQYVIETNRDRGYPRQFDTEHVVGKLREKHRRENSAYINHLIKEFELRKNAKMLLHAKPSKTGKLDIRKIHKYQICDDVFSRTMSFPEGTNHGMCMFFDLSGSMSNSIHGVIRQILILSEFCTKLNIPFRVFGFSNNEKSFRAYNRAYNDRASLSGPRRDVESEDYYFGQYFHLKEYISSYLSKNDYKKAFDQLLLLGEVYYQRSRIRYGRYATNSLETDTLSDYEGAILATARLQLEDLGSTPLVSATMASIDIVNGMIEKHNIENMIAIVLTDGCDDNSNTIRTSEYYGVDSTAPAVIQHHNGVRMLTEKRLVSAFTSFSVSTATKFAKKVTGAKYICYDLIHSIPQTVRLYEAVERPNHDKTRNTLRNKKYLISKKFGYDDYFFIVNEDTINSEVEDSKWESFWSGEESFGDGNLIITKPKKLTAKTIAKKFATHQNQKHLVRIMLAEFAKSIAESV